MRRWFAEAGFDEPVFPSPSGAELGGGAHRLRRHLEPLRGGQRMFTFVGYDTLR